MTTWIDLLDPGREELGRDLPTGIHQTDVAQFCAPGPGARPGLASRDVYVFGVLLVPVADIAANDLFYQEIDLVLTGDLLLTVRKTTPGRRAYEPQPIDEARGLGDSSTMHFYRLVDDVADRFLDVVDALEEEIGELEDNIELWAASDVTARIRSLRQQILHVRRTLGPLRDAVRTVADGRIELPFTVDPRRWEHEFAGIYDRLLRASDGLELAHDLLAGTRDYYQARVAQDQNEVVKRLTAIASILLVPTLIVGIYGQNFDFPERDWGDWGYGWSLLLIIGVTVAQVIYFRRKNWL